MSASRAPYERLIEDLRLELRPQREWGEGRGLFLVIGHFVVGIGAGAWAMGLVFESRAALVLAFALAALGGLSHLAFLGHPERFWRMSWQFKSSWISRGFAGLSAFLLGGFLYLAPQALPGLPWGAASLLGQLGYGLAFLGMLALLGYMGFVYSASKAIPFWGSALHPLLYLGQGLRGGVAALLVVALFEEAKLDQTGALLWTWLAVTGAVALLFALELHAAATSGNPAARGSVRELLAGRLALGFYAGTLFIGILVPAWLALAGLQSSTTLGAMALLGLASAVGDFFWKYSVIRAGIHLPVWIPMAPQRK